MSTLRVNSLKPRTGNTVTIVEGNTLSVTGIASVAGTMNVTGQANFASGANVTGVVTFANADLNSNLTVDSLTSNGTVEVGAGKSIKLNGASSGYTEIVAAAGSGSTTFVLPANGGSASQYLQTDGTGVLSWADIAQLSNAEDGTGTDFEFNSGFGSNATAYGCRAWVNFNGTGTIAIRDNGNVSSLTDLAIGKYRVTFTNNMPDTNYCAIGSIIGSLSSVNASTNTFVTTNETNSNTATNYVEVRAVHVSSGNQDHSTVQVAVFR